MSTQSAEWQRLMAKEETTELIAQALKECIADTPANLSVVRTIDELVAEQNWLGLAALEAEARAAAVSLEATYPDIAAGIYGNLGTCFKSLGKYEKAIDLHDQDLVLCEATGDRVGKGAACMSLGICHFLMGQYRKSILLFEQAKAVAEELGDATEQGRASTNLGNCYESLEEFDQAIVLHEVALSTAIAIGDREDEAAAYGNLGNCYESLRDFEKAVGLLEKALAIFKEEDYRLGEAAVYGSLGSCFSLMGQYEKAMSLLEKASEIFDEEGDRAGQGNSLNTLGATLAKYGNNAAAACTLARCLAVWQRVEQDVGTHDDRRVSLLEEQQKTYMHLQGVLLSQGQAGWSLGVSAQAKARALSHRLGFDDTSPDGDNAHDTGDALADMSYETVCGAWWDEVQEMARREGSATRIIEFSFLFDDQLAIWVISGAGELLCSTTVPTRLEGGGVTKGCTIQQLLTETRKSMKVQGRDATAHSPVEQCKELAGTCVVSQCKTFQTDSHQGKRSLERGNKCKVCQLRFTQCKCADAKAVCHDEGLLLRELYMVLVAPVEAHLVGAEEVLIVPHKELFEVPWAALLAADGSYLIERHVIRVAPSLRVARQATDSMQFLGKKKAGGHALVVGNPWPNGVGSLQGAEEEALSIARIFLNESVHVKLHVAQGATKGKVKPDLEGAVWAHFACHGDKNTNSLVLATPPSCQPGAEEMEERLSMEEVQGREKEAGMQKVAGVQLGSGSTIVLSACNTGAGEIKAEGVVGLSRGFLLAGAAATVVSLWSVDDGSTKALMYHMYQHLVKGCTVPQALRFAMLYLARQPAAKYVLRKEPDDSDAEGLEKAANLGSQNGDDVMSASEGEELNAEWIEPMHWAGFLVVGANTRLPTRE